MTRNKKISIINLVIYLCIFITDVVLVGLVKGSLADAFRAVFGSSDVYIGSIASAVVMIIAMITLIICGVATVVNVILKILQISFDKWGFSVASVIIDSLMILWTGIVTVSYLSGAASYIGFICLGLLLAEIAALTMECVVISRRKDT